ncbi:MAG TPA: hypothetical protein VFE98_10085 [Candidatus Bathyarchaeia archaeon]|nr:hypothetical protein [Candidatus Bathyarchaeia archaeon]
MQAGQIIRHSLHNGRNFLLCLFGTFIFFILGSLAVLYFGRFLPRNLEPTSFILQLSITLTIVISLIAMPLGFLYMYLFGGVLSTKAIRLYLFITKGKHVITSKLSELEAIHGSKGLKLALTRQVKYFGFILAVVVSFAIYLSKNRGLPTVNTTRTSDILSVISQEFVLLTMAGSLMIPVVALALPYFGGLRLRTIDVGPFHTTVLSMVIGASGGFTLLYSILARPVINEVLYYLLLFMGVCWCFALGCNLAADPTIRHVVHTVLRQKTTSKLVSSKIWLENPPGQFREI